MKDSYKEMSVKELRLVAREKGIKGFSTMKKADLLAQLTEISGDAGDIYPDKRSKQAKTTQVSRQMEKSEKRPGSRENVSRDNGKKQKKQHDDENGRQGKVLSNDGVYYYPPPEYIDEPPTHVYGVLEVLSDGYGFIRSENYTSGENDVYVAPQYIKRFSLRTGDMVTGEMRRKASGERFGALTYVSNVNGINPQVLSSRHHFEKMTPIFPNERLLLERDDSALAMRVVDLISPIGKGQRGMIVSQPKAGKTTLLKQIAKSIQINSPEVHMIILLIDERPEEVTDIKEAIKGDNVEIIYSTFDELSDHHRRVSEMVIERAKRLVEQEEDVVILLDSITRLTRAYNLAIPASGRTLSGGLDPMALHMPKKFFGAARNMREGGSLTILATALVETGSKMDDVVYEEFKGTGNMELVLNRKLSERRIFPAIDIIKSSTRREDLLLTPDEQLAVNVIRRQLNGLKADEAAEQILNIFATKTKTNKEFLQYIKKKINKSV